MILHRWWKWKLLQALWKSLAASKVHLPTDSAIPLLIICPKKASRGSTDRSIFQARILISGGQRFASRCWYGYAPSEGAGESSAPGFLPASSLYAEYIMRNTGLDKAQAGIKIAVRNLINFRYADDTILMAESEELKRFLMKVKEESEKVGLKLNIYKTKIKASGPITSWQIYRITVETVAVFILGGLQNHCRWWLQSWN